MEDLFMKKFDKECREGLIFCLSPLWAVIIGIILIMCFQGSAQAQGYLNKVYADYKMHWMKQQNPPTKYLHEEFPEAWNSYKKFIDSLGVSVIPSYCYKYQYSIPKKTQKARWTGKVRVVQSSGLLSGRFFIDRGDGLGYYALYHDDDSTTFLRLSEWEATWGYYMYKENYYMNNTFEQNVRYYYASVADYNHACNEEEKLIKMYNQIEQKVAEVLKYVKANPKEKRALELYYEKQFYMDVSDRWARYYKYTSTNSEYPNLNKCDPIQSNWSYFDYYIDGYVYDD
jgi:hypothetical protein